MKSIWLTATILIFHFPVLAQFKFGIQAGINLSQLDQNIFEESISKLTTNYFVGISPRISLDGLSIIGDVNYSVKGSKVDTEMDGEIKYKYAYVELNPQIEFRLIEILGVSIGPSFSIKLDEQINWNDQTWSKTKESIKNSDFGAYFAARVYLDRVYGMMAYNHGLTDINDVIHTDIDGIIRGDVSSKNRNIQLGIGFLF
jgi:hypothetical protein